MNNAALDTDQFVQKVIGQIAEEIKNLHTLNIIVAGKTGVGKSTLINSVFREKLAQTGVGKPVTDHMCKLTKKGVPLSIYDTRGFELGKEVQTAVKKEIFDTIQKGLAAHDINEAIHCIWYCINTASNRVEPEEIAWLRALSAGNQTTQVPIIIVLTQSLSMKKANELKALLQTENLDVAQIVPVLAEDYEVDEEYTKRAFGLNTLIEVMGQVLPEELLKTLQNVQIASLEEKKRHAHAAVVAASAAAAGAGAIPIPFSDCFVLIPTQIGMIASITVIFGFEISKSILSALVTSVLGTSAATLTGKTFISGFLKLFPGAGSVAGGAISAGTAAVLTTALGEAYIRVMELVFRGEMRIEDIASEKGKETMRDAFQEQLKSSK